MQVEVPIPSGDRVVVLSLGGSDRLAAHIALLAVRPVRLHVVDPLLNLGVLASAFPDAGIAGTEAVAGPADGPVEIRLFTLPGLVSLAPATAELKALYPNIAEREWHSVAQRALAALAAEIGAASTVVLDAPGHEKVLLDELAAIGWFETASLLSVRCTRDICFEGGLGAGALAERLIAEGYALVAEVNDDPDWPILTFRTEPAQREVRRLTERLRERDAAMTQAAEAWEGELSALRAEVEARTRERDAARAEENRLRALGNATQQALQDNQEALKAETEAHTLSERRCKQILAERDAARAEENRLRDAGTALQAKQAETDANLAIALRMQVIALNDLKALREKYNTVQKTCVAQESLLRALTPRLQEAASQIRALMRTEAPTAKLAVTRAQATKPRAGTQKKA